MDEKERQDIEGFKYQLGRFASDWESEKDNRKHLADRVRTWDKIQELQQKQIDKHEKALFNDGKGGIAIDVDRLVQEKKNSGETLYKWLSIASTLIALISLYLNLK